MLRRRPHGAVGPHHHAAAVGHRALGMRGEAARRRVDRRRAAVDRRRPGRSRTSRGRVQPAVARRRQARDSAAARTARGNCRGRPRPCRRSTRRRPRRSSTRCCVAAALRDRLREKPSLVVAGNDDRDYRASRVHTNPLKNRRRSSARKRALPVGGRDATRASAPRRRPRVRSRWPGTPNGDSRARSISGLRISA